MKTFDQIIKEARTTRAAIQARGLKLQPDGHGGYYNQFGELIAKGTTNNKGNSYLNFYNQNQKPSRDPTQIRTRNNQQPIGTQVEYHVIRDRYINNEIFNVGDYIKEINTGNVGKIIRRGTNYLICVTEDNTMFKPWLTDVIEWTEVSGVPASQREVGTDSLRKYVMKLTGVNKIKNFINKYKK